MNSDKILNEMENSFNDNNKCVADEFMLLIFLKKTSVVLCEIRSNHQRIL